MKPVKLTEKQWDKLLTELHNNYPTSVLAIYAKTKRILGFTVRSHRQWIINPTYHADYVKYQNEYGDGTNNEWFSPGAPEKGRYESQIHLDFYKEATRTFFLLKYSEFMK